MEVLFLAAVNEYELTDAPRSQHHCIAGLQFQGEVMLVSFLSPSMGSIGSYQLLVTQC